MNYSEHYVKESVIGSGTYGTVYKVKHKKSKEYFAMKKINVDETEDGIPASTLREVGILLEFKQYNHPNIVCLNEVIHKNGSIAMIFEYVDWDLKRYMEEYSKQHASGSTSIGLPLNITQSLARQLLEAVAFCHQYRVFHRDLKPSNLLVNNNGVLKLADLGLARTFSLPHRTYCHEVVTLWYRAPEVMLGSTFYGPEIDIWSVGCILVEMITGSVLFPGDSEIDQLLLIFRRFGTPYNSTWPGVEDFPDYKITFPAFQQIGYKDLSLPREAFPLVEAMLKYIPDERQPLDSLRLHPFVQNTVIVPLETFQ